MTYIYLATNSRLIYVYVIAITNQMKTNTIVLWNIKVGTLFHYISDYMLNLFWIPVIKYMMNRLPSPLCEWTFFFFGTLIDVWMNHTTGFFWLYRLGVWYSCIARRSWFDIIRFSLFFFLMILCRDIPPSANNRKLKN